MVLLEWVAWIINPKPFDMQGIPHLRNPFFYAVVVDCSWTCNLMAPITMKSWARIYVAMMLIPAMAKGSLKRFSASRESEMTKRVAPNMKNKAVLLSSFWYCHMAADNITLIVMPYNRTGTFIGPRYGHRIFINSTR